MFTKILTRKRLLTRCSSYKPTGCSFPRLPSRRGRARRCARSSVCRRERRGSGRSARGSASSGSQTRFDGSAPGTAATRKTVTTWHLIWFLLNKQGEAPKLSQQKQSNLFSSFYFVCANEVRPQAHFNMITVFSQCCSIIATPNFSLGLQDLEQI